MRAFCTIRTSRDSHIFLYVNCDNVLVIMLSSQYELQVMQLPALVAEAAVAAQGPLESAAAGGPSPRPSWPSSCVLGLRSVHI